MKKTKSTPVLVVKVPPKRVVNKPKAQASNAQPMGQTLKSNGRH